MPKSVRPLVLVLLASCLSVPPGRAADEGAPATISLEAETPKQQDGSLGEDRKRAASGGRVLGLEFGSRPGHFAEYEIDVTEGFEHARVAVRYARALEGHSDIGVSIDGEERGFLRCEPTGGWGDEARHFGWTSVDVGALDAGKRTLRLTVLESRKSVEYEPISLESHAVLDAVGGRSDKNSVGHGGNVALYTGSPPRFFYATHEMGNVFSAATGATLDWYPDQVIVGLDAGGGLQPNVNLDRVVVSEAPEESVDPPGSEPERLAVVEQRQVCVTPDDVVVVRIHLHNRTTERTVHRIPVHGDITQSRGWRGRPGGDKKSQKIGDFMVLVDENVFPGVLGGLAMAIGGARAPDALTTVSAGTYEMRYDVALEAGARATLVLACAFDPDVERAQAKLVRTLAVADPVAENRREWARFYDERVPRFTSSDASLDELYAFRWFLLRFSTAGGGLGLFRHPVVLEGRQAYQTYCCFSAPFMAFDLAWAADERVGYGHIASLFAAAYEDGRLPWYTAPDTNRVPIHHRSGTGLSLLPLAAWKHYEVHGSKTMLESLYPAAVRNVEWWVRDRDADGDGLFVIDHQLETGMDDLMRWPDPELRYDAVDATSYAYANLGAVAKMADALGKRSDALRYAGLAAKSKSALEALWDDASASWRDRHPETKELSDLLAITTFYPLFAGMGLDRAVAVLRRNLLDPEKFWTPHPVPAVSKSHPSFNPRGFWRGPSWPAATSHVVEALASAAKVVDRSLLPQAAELFRRAAKNHLAPRADFYERYDPDDGTPLSTFRDYMHSWWIDIWVRHVAGFEVFGSGDAQVDALPLGLSHWSLEGLRVRGRRVDIAYECDAGREGRRYSVGLTVLVDGREVVRREDWKPGDDPVAVSIGRRVGE